VQRYLLIVSRREEARVYEVLKQAFTNYPHVDVILDRRQPLGAESHPGDRRSADIDPLLQRVGWVLVKQRTAEN